MKPQLTHNCNMDQQPPQKGSYVAVLRRYDKNCAYPIPFTTYAERTHSRAIVMNGQVAHTLFVSDPATARRAQRLGWTDETEAWFKYLDGLEVKPTGDTQKKLFSFVSEHWQTKAEIIKSAGIKDSQWRTAITALHDKGLIEKQGFGSATAYRLKQG